MESPYADPLVESRPTGHMNVFKYQSTQSSHIISKIKTLFHQYFIYIQYDKTMASKENHMID